MTPSSFTATSIFNARNFFAAVRDPLKRHQFGGVIGGPIIKDKLFVFGGYQGTFESTSQSAVFYVPTAATLAGDFTAFESPACHNVPIIASSNGDDLDAMPWPAWTPSHERRIVIGNQATVEPMDVERMTWLRAHPATPVARTDLPKRSTPRD